MRRLNTPSKKGSDAASDGPDQRHGNGQNGSSASGDIHDRLLRERVRERLFGKKLATIQIAGRFTLLGMVGTGGMGEIYAAYDDVLDRKVAIKLVRASVRQQVTHAGTNASPADVRLLREAKMLARLSHPNVVQIHDAGTYEDRVFIAMEFIRGVNMRQWLQQCWHSRTSRQHWRRVLAMFLNIGQGLEAAHRAGVAHRDFKPENVLIGDDDRPRVVDFGLARISNSPDAEQAADTRQTAGARHAAGARATADNGAPTGAKASGSGPCITQATTVDDDGGELVSAPAPDGPPASGPVLQPATWRSETTRVPTFVTTRGQLVGTPLYMAPEQLRGEPADAVSDQFGFCVALYEALYGQRPFQGDTLEILEQTITSGKITTPPRGTAVPASVRQALLRGLSADRADRFSDMGQLMQALDMEDRIRRRRWTMAATGAALAVASTAAIVWSLAVPADPCLNVTASMEEVWNDTGRERVAQAFAQTGLPYAATTWTKLDGTIAGYVEDWRSARMRACTATHVDRVQSAELMDRRMLCLDEGQHQLAATMEQFSDADAAVVERAADAVAALPPTAWCDDADRLAYGIAPPMPQQAAEVAAVRKRLAAARTGHIFGHYRDALQIARAQVVNSEKIDYPPVQAEALHVTGRILLHDGTRVGQDIDEIAQGEELLSKASLMAEGVRHDWLLAEIWQDLTLATYRHDADTERGHRRALRAQAVIRRLGDPPRLVTDLQRSRALLYFKDKEYARAEAELGQALAGIDAHADYERAIFLRSLGNSIRMQRRFEEAEDLYRQAIAHAEAALGPMHPTVASIRFEVAQLNANQGRYDEARELFLSVLGQFEQAWGPHHERVAKVHWYLAKVYRHLGQLERAREHLRAAREVYEAIDPAGSIPLAEVLIQQGTVEFRRGEFRNAIATYQRALGMQNRFLRAGHIRIGESHANIAEAYLNLDLHDEALRELALAEAVFANYPDNVLYHTFAAGLRGQALMRLGRTAAAIAALEAAVAGYDKLGSHPVERADVLWALARAVDADPGVGKARRARRLRAAELACEALAVYQQQGDEAEEMRQTMTAWLASRDMSCSSGKTNSAEP